MAWATADSNPEECRERTYVLEKEALPGTLLLRCRTHAVVGVLFTIEFFVVARRVAVVLTVLTVKSSRTPLLVYRHRALDGHR